MHGCVSSGSRQSRMTDSTPECNQPATEAPRTPSLHLAVLGGVCALVIGVYVWSAQSGGARSGGLSADKSCYNLLVQGFRAGQPDLKREVPSELAPRLASPDPAARRPYWYMDQQLLDLSYYR